MNILDPGSEEDLHEPEPLCQTGTYRILNNVITHKYHIFTFELLALPLDNIMILFRFISPKQHQKWSFPSSIIRSITLTRCHVTMVLFSNLLNSPWQEVTGLGQWCYHKLTFNHDLLLKHNPMTKTGMQYLNAESWIND